MRVTIVMIAQACHAINAAYCSAMGDNSQPAWADAPEAIRNSAINGVALHITNPDMSPAASHEAWMQQKTREGWKHGPVKDFEKKTHPCYLPYDELPAEQRAKDYLFKATVAQFRPLLPGGEIAQAEEIAKAFNNPAPAEIRHKSAEELESQASAEHDEKVRLTKELEDLQAKEPKQKPNESNEKFYTRLLKWQERCEALKTAIHGGEAGPNTPHVENPTEAA